MAQPGESVQIRGLHANGDAYRWWDATLEAVSATEISLVWPGGTRFGAPTEEGRKLMRYDCRMLLWPGKPFTLVELYGRDGLLVQVAMDIASRQRLEGHTAIYVDHELDVVKTAGKPAHVEDEDEFEEAAETYGYSAEFREQCMVDVREALAVIDSWMPRGHPPWHGYTGPPGCSR